MSIYKFELNNLMIYQTGIIGKNSEIYALL
jgi:hypothetical protein